MAKRLSDLKKISKKIHELEDEERNLVFFGNLLPKSRKRHIRNFVKEINDVFMEYVDDFFGWTDDEFSYKYSREDSSRLSKMKEMNEAEDEAAINIEKYSTNHGLKEKVLEIAEKYARKAKLENIEELYGIECLNIARLRLYNEVKNKYSKDNKISK